jgi:hypothetical protein
MTGVGATVLVGVLVGASGVFVGNTVETSVETGADVHPTVAPSMTNNVHKIEQFDFHEILLSLQKRTIC